MHSIKLKASAIGLLISSFWGTSLSAQEAIDESWLPLRLSDALSNSLQAVSQHALTREGCDDLLESKISENTSQDDPKFIVTCTTGKGESLNFVYWQSDVDEQFVSVKYAKKSEQQFLTGEELAIAREKEIRTKNSTLITQCKDELSTTLLNRDLQYTDSGVHINQRGESPAVVNIDYQIGAGDYSPKFTATCRKNFRELLELSVFPR